MDISKDESKKDPRYFVNPVIKNKDPENDLLPNSEVFVLENGEPTKKKN